MTDAVVAGGGLAGLVATRHLADAGLDVTLFERDQKVGGRVQSDREDGFVLDRGFQVLFPSYPAARRELDLDALSLRGFKPGATLVRPGERTTLSDPLRDPGALLATVLNRDVTIGDKLRILRLRRELARTSLDDLDGADDMDIVEYLDRRGFSERFRERFIAPFYGGITLDRSLSSSAFVFAYTFKMLSTSRATVPAEGMGAVTAQLAESAREAGATIEAGTTVEAVEPAGDSPADGAVVETTSETIETAAAVVATDPPTGQELTGVESIPTVARGCVTQYFSLPTTQHLAGSERLLLNVADARPNQVAVLSAVAPEYAPEGKRLLSATFLGEQSATDEQLAEEVRAALGSWFPENNFADLELLRTDRIPFAQLSQQPGFRGQWPAVDAPEGAVYLAGEYTDWSAIQGALDSGREAAEAARADIDGR
ncbi:Phytoene dehydrogenase-related protein [Halovenus aranensis]|uniref:Phytoene dehydrogenase-related protein n=1 Tax=Halovenus aranensis TaxID=890420 RepID=A0A1G8WJ01_9EURY|nr:NAD(P)/FAD-dependent oxidoreductase [Halovenus aranensis]SDJ78332.1 Phytoene dehydrogenase-related protein [Halovenus aranensis]